MAVTVMTMTAVRPGAIAIVQLEGEGTPALLGRLLRGGAELAQHGPTNLGSTQAIRTVAASTGEQARRLNKEKHALEPGDIRLVRVAGIDDALLARLDEDTWQLMPHGGPRVVTRLVQACVEAGATVTHEPQAQTLYPEASSPIEADMLKALALAASPAAVDRLLAQPDRWIAWCEGGGPCEPAVEPHPWDVLLHPPTVVVIGRPNVGKSTLLNALAGRALSLVADLPGTTRDWVGGFVELPWRGSFVAVRWLDTPGFRATDDRAERAAIASARALLREADVLIAMRDFEHDWPDGADLPRAPHLHVVNKCDTAQRMADASSLAPRPHRVIPLCAESGDGLETLIHAVIDRLGLESVDETSRWPFSQTLRAGGDLSAYVSSWKSSR